MVSIEGEIPPFRISRVEFFGLVSQLKQRLDALPSPISLIEISLGKFSERCTNISELETFMKDFFLPKVVKEATLLIESPKIYLMLNLSASYARYHINGAKDTSEARSFEDVILTFFNNHRVPSLCNMYVEGFATGLSIVGSVSLISLVLISFVLNHPLAYRGPIIFSAFCSFTFLAYNLWTKTTPDTPSLSFYYSLIWVEKPKTNVIIGLVSTIIIGVIVSYLLTIL